MLSRQSSTFTGLLLIFLLVACIPKTNGDESSAPDDDPAIVSDGSQESSEPPLATLTIDGREQTAGITSYCWQQGDGTGICADAIGVATDPEPIPAGSTLLAEFTLPLEVRPGRVQLSIFPASELVSTDPDRNDWLYWKPVTGDQYTLPPNQNPLIELTLRPGPYVFSLFVDWPDHGEVSYGFFVDVGGALQQDAAAFADDQYLSLEEAMQRLRFQDTIGDDPAAAGS